MVEKIWVCSKCNYVPQNIPYEEQPRICPKCNSPCKESDFIPAGHFGADTKAIMEDYKREGKVLEPVNPDEKEKEIPKLSAGLEAFLKKHTSYDGNNILIVQAENGRETWIRTDQLISYGFKLLSTFSEVDVIDHTLIFEQPEWRKRNEKGEYD